MLGFLKGRLISVRLALLLTTLLLLAGGIATIYAVGHPAEPSPAGPGEDLSIYWKKQVVFAIVGFAGFLAANVVNYRRLGAVSVWLYCGVLGLLVLLLAPRFVQFNLAGLIALSAADDPGAILSIYPINGTFRWINLSLGPHSFSIQPSELCKLAHILALAWYLRYRSNYRSFKALVGPFLLTLLPMALILLEPDLGTVILMMPVLFTMLFVAGAKARHLALIALMAALVSPLLWMKMKPYQRTRISSVLLQSSWVRHQAENRPWVANILLGEKFKSSQWTNHWGYHLWRSTRAVASGGENGGWGHGFRKGPFIKYRFLPERHNDFIFAVIAQQWGFWGSLILLGLYTLLAACGLEIAVGNTDPFGRLLAVGIVAMFVVEVLVNISMTMGIMPVTGLTLPFVSYGGSSLLTSFAAVGLLNNVGRCRPFSLAPKT